jgi:hypothetical protein
MFYQEIYIYISLNSLLSNILILLMSLQTLNIVLGTLFSNTSNSLNPV